MVQVQLKELYSMNCRGFSHTWGSVRRIVCRRKR